MLKKVLIGLGIVLIVIQFIRPDKNESNDLTYDISTKYQVPEDVNQLLQVSCNDCHSNKTEYPWYANVQPVAWWLNDHVMDGKRHLNFSEFTKRPIAIQNHKFEETIEMVEKKEMPLADYTYLGLHPEAKLTDAQRTKIVDWAKAQMAYLKNNYPADSLVMPKRQGAPASK
ncbi:MAG: heme-binding domain-containing protein [Flavobacteriaceae bacterium]